MTLKRFVHITSRFRMSVKSGNNNPKVAKTTSNPDNVAVALNKALGSTSIVVVIFVVLALIFGNL